jgi:flagellar motility protein MotE (MotC chaperone)
MHKIRILPLLLLVVFVSVVVKAVDFSGHYDLSDLSMTAARMTALAKSDEPDDSESIDGTKEAVWKSGAPDGPQLVKPTGEFKDRQVVLESLAERRKKLEEWAESIALKENLLSATRNKINKKMGELLTLKQEVSTLLEQYELKEKYKIDRMVKIYESMKAKSAANIFEKMDLKILMQVISNMKESKAAPILAKIAPERARVITESLILQGRLRQERSQ